MDKKDFVQIIDIAVLADCNVTSKEAEKIEKYRDLSIELVSLRKMKCKVVPIKVGCLGCVSHLVNSELKYLLYSGNLLREEIFANLAVLLSEEIFAIFNYS